MGITAEHEIELPGWVAQRVLAIASEHLHIAAGFPFVPEAGECEVCDTYWLLRNEEGDRKLNLHNLACAVAEEEQNAHHG